MSLVWEGYVGDIRLLHGVRTQTVMKRCGECGAKVRITSDAIKSHPDTEND